MANQVSNIPDAREILVAIDLGSSSVKAMAARRIDENTLQILGVESSSRYSCMKDGAVVQSSNAGFTIRELLQLLANRLGVKELPQAFIVNGGMSMMVKPITWRHDMLIKTPITQQIMDEMEAECIQNVETNNPHAAVLALVPAYYDLNGKKQTECPTTKQKAETLNITYSVFAGKRELVQKVQDSFDRAVIVIEKTFARPDAQLSALISDHNEYFEKGCAVVDFGAQTTTVTVYKGSHYLECRVIPLGGWHITRFIEQQGVEPPYSEAIKTRYGYASPELMLADQEMQDATMKLQSSTSDNGFIRLKISELAEIIQMKEDEIIDKVLTVLKPYEERISTIILTGGASKLKGLAEYIQQKTTLNVDYGSFAPLLDYNTPDEYYMPEYSSLVGALILGSDYRNTHPKDTLPERATTLRERLKAVKQKIMDQTVDIFSQPERK
ncbi:MAG: rod shape-determining protein [Paludibacteraceae bacterium]|nr:rod shape-determining protein [Paludibacteraceae bacterium]